MNNIGEITKDNKSASITADSFAKTNSNFPLTMSLLIVLSLVSLSLHIFTLFDGYPVTLSAIVIMFYCLYITNHLRINHITVYLLIICFLVANAATHWMTLNSVEFTKSFLLTSVMMFVYITSLRPQHDLRKLINYSLILRASTYAILGFELIQIFEELFLGHYSSWFWLDGLSISTAKSVGRFEAVFPHGFFRPVSFYHEPSYLAAVSFILLLINDRTICIKHVSKLLITSIILSLSAIGIGLLLLYLTNRIWCKNITLFVFAACVAAILSPFYGIEVLKFLRLPEIFIEGTSGYIRLVEPLILTCKALSSSPFGIPLGQSEVIFNNSLYLIFLYFGLLTPVLMIAWISVIWSQTMRFTYFINYFLGVAFLLLVSGAIFTLESAFLLLLLNYSFMDNYQR
jgi:hypothetical protein